MKLAYFSPLNPVQSGISDYSEDLLPSLAHYATLDLFVDNYTPTNTAITSQFATYPSAKYNSSHYDAGLFHMGNSDVAHAGIYKALKKEAGKGILVLHEYVLHHFYIGLYLKNGKALDYLRLMTQRYGAEGETVAREVIKGRFTNSLFWYPLCEEVIEASRAVLVHSQYAKNLIQAKYPDKKVGIARMGVPLPSLVDRQFARAELGLPDDQFVLLSTGHINPYKRLDSVLWAFRAFSREFPNSRFILVGSLSSNYDVKSMITALGLEKRVELVGYVTGERYQTYLAAADVCVNLRYPTAGETSASLLRIMGAGRPVLVSRIGSFDELPDDTCVKVDVDDAEEELLLEYLRLLAREPELRTTLGNNARRYVATAARLEDAARDYYLFLCDVLGVASPLSLVSSQEKPEVISHKPEGENSKSAISNLQSEIPPTLSPQSSIACARRGINPQSSILDEVGQAAAELGFDENDPALEDVARAIAFIEPTEKF